MTRLKGAAEYFALMVETETDECVLWPGGHSSSGYGTLNLGRKAKNVHVLACELRHGPRPAGTDAAHSCGVKSCFNPKHLRWASRSENEADKVKHGTSNRGDHRTCKLSVEQVQAIRELALQGVTHEQIACTFNISRQHAGDVISRKKWSWT